ncbi:MAG: hypothetical protein LEGION0398_MBIBDBAK_00256 [Legionellaceae bacterium]
MFNSLLNQSHFIREISLSDFNPDLLKAKKPFIIKSSEKLTEGLTPQIIANIYGQKIVQVGVFDQSVDKNFPTEQLQMHLSEAVDIFIANRKNSYKYYLMQEEIATEFPKLLNYMEPYQALVRQFDLFSHLWFGEAGTLSPLHFDAFNNLFYQAYGKKLFILFPPSDTPFLYPQQNSKRFNFSSIDDLEKVDVERFPLAVNAKPYQVIVDTHDILYLPSGWWHYVYSMDLSISISGWWKPSMHEVDLSQLFRLKAWECYENDTVSKMLNFVDFGKPNNMLELAQHLTASGNYWLAIIFAIQHLKNVGQAVNQLPNPWQTLLSLAKKEDNTLLIKEEVIGLLNYIAKHSE